MTNRPQISHYFSFFLVFILLLGMSYLFMLQLKVELQSAPNLNLLAVTSLSIFLIASAGVLWHVGCWLFLQTELSPFVITLPTVILSAYFLYLVLHTWVHLPLETIDEGGLLYRSVR